MVSQGLPSYSKLVRGKSTLVKYFLQRPGCAPIGSKIEVTRGQLFVNGSGTPIDLAGLLPLPEVAPASTAPVPAAQGDPLFIVPGSALSGFSLDATSVAFTSVIDFRSTLANGSVQTGSLTVDKRANGTPVQAVIEKKSNPLRVGVFPMGNAGTATAPTDYASQFSAKADGDLAAGFESLHRVLPLPDGVGRTTDAAAGLRWDRSAGLINLGSHVDPETKQQVSFISGTNRYCGRPSHFTYIAQELETARTNWNSMNSTSPIDLAYGVVDEAISTGPTTGGSVDCVDGYASVGGKQGWGRVIGEVPGGRAGLTGSIAAMELLHNTGSVAQASTRFDGGFHSKNLEADTTARDRAWNTSGMKWISQDRSSLNYQTAGWNDGTSVLEKEDFDLLLCQLTPKPLIGATSCPQQGTVGRAAASATVGSAFFLSGSTDGTAAGTDAHTYIDDDVNYEAPDPTSAYRFVQRNALGTVVRSDGFSVNGAASHHHGSTAGSGQVHVHRGTFGTEFPADPAAVKIQLWKGVPDAPGSVLLHDRDRNTPPAFVGLSVAGRSVTASVLDETPERLKLDMFYRCPGQTSPLANALEPLVVGRLAVFTASYDTSLGCANGTLVYRVSDGYLVAEQDDALTGQTAPDSQAAIYTPQLGELATIGKVIGLSGAGRDAAGNTAADIVWTIQGPSYPSPLIVARGADTFFVPPAGLVAGSYDLRLSALDANGTEFASSTRPLALRSDVDFDGIADVDETLSCYGPGAVLSAANAVADPDFDGFASLNDASPCVSANNITVKTTANSVNAGSNGNSLTVQVLTSATDLRTIDPQTIGVVQIAGHRTFFPPTSIKVDGPGTALAKYDRQAIASFMQANGLTGDVPIFIGTTDGTLRGVDPDSPNVF